MKGDLVNAQWAREARAAVKLAAKDMSATFPRATGGKCLIAWGHANYEDAAFEEETSLRFQRQYGLMTWNEKEIELTISRHGDDDYPNFVDLFIGFASLSEQELLLPLSPQLLYNVLACLDRNVKLRLCPRREPVGILVVGAESSIPVEGLTGRILHDAVSRLHSSQVAVDAICGSGDDRWKTDLGE